jgi:methylglutamate dehydrogenase subunit D
MSEIALEPVSGFAGSLAGTGPAEWAGVTIRARAALRAATVIARGDSSALAGRLRAAYGLEIAEGAKRSVAGDLAFVGVGPRSWLALSENAAFFDKLRLEAGDAAAVSDQSSGYAILRLTGPKTRTALEKGVSIDLHPRAFPLDAAAITSCAAIGIVLWQIDAAPTYEIAVARSFAADFCHWLLQSAAEFGVNILPAN